MLDLFAPTVTDLYKPGHENMIPEGTTFIYVNFTARSSRLFRGLDDYDGKAVIVGIQRAVDDIMDLWDRSFFRVPKAQALARFERRLRLSLTGNCDLTSLMERFGRLHDIGHLPLRIRALPEGRRVGMRVPFMTVENTDPGMSFLTNYEETIFSDELWKTIVNATTAFEYRRLLERMARRTTGSCAGVLFQAHDFSMRGMSGFHDAANTGIAHLSCFVGSDTTAAADVVEHHYPEPDGQEADLPVLKSVPATEHLVMCLGGRDSELGTFRRIITEKYPTGIVSIVSDTWNFFSVMTRFVTELKDDILARRPDDSGMARVVFRPDSGDPVKIICGDPDAPVGSPEHKGAVECLHDVFGGTVSEQGFIVLNPAVGVIYGDSITLERAQAILEGLEKKGFASTNVVLGIGSFTYQHVTRDTLGIASKGTYAVVDGLPVLLQKDPATDDGTKKSALGLLRVDEVNGEYLLRENVTPDQAEGGALQVIYDSGRFHNRSSWSSVRHNINLELEARG